MHAIEFSLGPASGITSRNVKIYDVTTPGTRTLIVNTSLGAVTEYETELADNCQYQLVLIDTRQGIACRPTIFNFSTDDEDPASQSGTVSIMDSPETSGAGFQPASEARGRLETCPTELSSGPFPRLNTGKLRRRLEPSTRRPNS